MVLMIKICCMSNGVVGRACDCDASRAIFLARGRGRRIPPRSHWGGLPISPGTGMPEDEVGSVAEQRCVRVSGRTDGPSGCRGSSVLRLPLLIVQKVLEKC